MTTHATIDLLFHCLALTFSRVELPAAVSQLSLFSLDAEWVQLFRDSRLGEKKKYLHEEHEAMFKY